MLPTLISVLMLCVGSALPFISTWEFDQMSSFLLLPGSLPFGIQVDWGDGITSNTLSHPYGIGTWNVSIGNGTDVVSGFKCMNSECANLVAIQQWGSFEISASFTEIFSNAHKLTGIYAVDQPRIAAGASFQGMFENCTSLNSVIRLDATGVTSFERMFAGASAFDSQLQFSDTSSVLNFTKMFHHADLFNQDLNFSTTSANSLRGMFSYASSFNKVLNFNTSSVLDFSEMFASALQFTQEVVFDMTGASDVSGMFDGTANDTYDKNFTGWEVASVTQCSKFCLTCSLPPFSCNPCEGSVKTSPTRNAVCKCPPMEYSANATTCANGGLFVSTWSVPAGLFTLPVQGVHYRVDWGDGTGWEGYNNDTTPSHSYGFQPLTTISIEGDFIMPTMPVISPELLLGISRWGGFTISNQSRTRIFDSCTNLQITATDQPKIMPGASLAGMFRFCTNLNFPISWDLSGAVSVADMFAFCTSFNSPVDLRTPDVIDMGGMFQGATAFNSLLTLDTQRVTNMEAMFLGTTSFDQALAFDTAQVKSMRKMFYNALNFSQVLSFNTSKVEDMSGMFWSSVFNQPCNFETGMVTDMSSMFYDAKRFNQSLSFDTRSVQSMAAMFGKASSFNRPIVFNTPQLTVTSRMFSLAASFNSPVTFLNSSRLQDISQMFAQASSFNQILNFSTSNVSTMAYMFLGASAFNKPVSHFDTSRVTSMLSMFESAHSFNQPVFTDLTHVTSIERMFFDARSFNQILSFQTSDVLTNASEMLAHASSFNSPVMLKNTSKVRSMQGMFQEAVSFNTSLTLDTSSCVTMSCMFSGAQMFNQPLVFSSTLSVENMSHMFAGAVSFSQPLSFNLTAGDRNQMFANATSFVQHVPDLFLNAACEEFCPFCSFPAAVATEIMGCDPCGGSYFFNNDSNAVCNCPPGQIVHSGVSAPVLSCDRIVCSPPYSGPPGSCVCASGFVGTVRYDNGNLTGCAPSPSHTTAPSSAPQTTGVSVSFSDSSPVTSINSSGVVVILSPDPVWGPNGTVVVVVNPPTPDTVSPVVTINFSRDGIPQNISNLTNPVVFVIPLVAGAATPIQVCMGDQPGFALPACNWFDTVDSTWKTSGCVTRLFPTEVECSCTHLTDFAAVTPKTNPVPLKQVLSLTSDNISSHPDGLITVMVVVALFGVVVSLAVFRDRREKNRESMLQNQKFDKWTKATQSQVGLKTRAKWWKQYKTGLQLRHTWGSMIFRKSGTTFRSVDRVFVTLFLVLILMSMSASFHDKNRTLFGRGEVAIFTILVCLVPSFILTHLFTHTGELGFYEKWQLQKGLVSTSKHKVLRYRFAEKWRIVWYVLTLCCSLGMILYILSISLMFDQNPHYYCQGKTTTSWIVDFIIPYVISVFLIEPLKIFLFVASKNMVQTHITRMTAESTAEGDQAIEMETVSKGVQQTA